MSWKGWIQSGGSSGFRGSPRTTASASSYGGESQAQRNGRGGKRTVVIGIRRDPVTGKVITEDIGKGLSEEQKRQISEKVSREGRLEVRRKEERTAAQIAALARQQVKKRRQKEGKPLRREGETQRKYYAGVQLEKPGRVVYEFRRQEEISRPVKTYEKREPDVERRFEDKRIEGFKYRVEGIEARQKKFSEWVETSSGMQRIRRTTAYMTDPAAWFTGVATDPDVRGWLGRYSHDVVYGLTTWSIYLPPAIFQASERALGVGEAALYPETRRWIPGEAKRSLSETVKIYDVTTPKGAALVTQAAIFALPTATGRVLAKQPIKASVKLGEKQVVRDVLKRDFVEEVKLDILAVKGKKEFVGGVIQRVYGKQVKEAEVYIVGQKAFLVELSGKKPKIAESRFVGYGLGKEGKLVTIGKEQYLIKGKSEVKPAGFAAKSRILDKDADFMTAEQLGVSFDVVKGGVKADVVSVTRTRPAVEFDFGEGKIGALYQVGGFQVPFEKLPEFIVSEGKIRAAALEQASWSGVDSLQVIDRAGLFSCVVGLGALLESKKASFRFVPALKAGSEVTRVEIGKTALKEEQVRVQVVKPKVTVKESTKEGIILRLRGSQVVVPKSELKPLMKTEMRSLSKTESRLEVENVLRSESKTEQRQMQRQVQKLELKQVQKYTMRTQPKPIFDMGREQMIYGTGGMGEIGRGERKRAGFDVFVRRLGRFEKINFAALARKEAMQFGAWSVGHTAAATFKLEETKEPVRQRFRGKGMMQDFYKKMGKGGMIFIEKRGRRIKSRGELQEITFKGLAAQRARKIWRL